MQASLELGIELGEDGLTMRGIAGRLGVSATALYQHYDGKGAILLDIRNHGYEKLWNSIEPALGAKNPLQRIEQICGAYVRFCRDNPWLYSVMIRHEADPSGPSFETGLEPDLDTSSAVADATHEGSAASSADPAGPEAGEPVSPADGLVAVDRSAQPLRACAQCVKSAVTAGLVPATLEPQVVAIQLWAACHGLCSLILNHAQQIAPGEAHLVEFGDLRPSIGLGARSGTDKPGSPLPADLDGFIDDFVHSIVGAFLRTAAVSAAPTVPESDEVTVD